MCFYLGCQWKPLEGNTGCLPSIGFQCKDYELSSIMNHVLPSLGHLDSPLSKKNEFTEDFVTIVGNVK